MTPDPSLAGRLDIHLHGVLQAAPYIIRQYRYRGDEVHALSSLALCRPTTIAHLGCQAIYSDFRFGGHLAALGREPIRSGGGLCRWRRSEAVLCTGWRGRAHVVPSRPPRQLDTLHAPARGV